MFHRSETMQAKHDLEDYLQNTLVNKLVISPVPNICIREPCILGIDEAGRGPVLGPMTYAVAYYPKSAATELTKLKFADSKTLTENTRDNLFESIGKLGFANIGYMIKILAPNMISNSMLRRNKYNLNALSHDTAIDLIKQVQLKGIEVSHVFLDTVGPADKYKAKLSSHFSGIQFTVANKADSLYPIVSAASVCAKVMRDRIVGNWKFVESNKLQLETYERGSGYPADPVTKKFLVDVLDPVFGFPTLARFSWSTVSNILEKSAIPCDWNEPDDDSTPTDPVQNSKQVNMMRNFIRKANVKKPSNSSISIRSSMPKSTSGMMDGRFQSSSLVSKRTNASVYFEDRMLSKVLSWPDLNN